MTNGKTFYGTKKREKREIKIRKIFFPFQIRKTFYRKMALFSVDHLFFVKQTPENAENIFLKVIFSETNGPLV